MSDRSSGQLRSAGERIGSWVFPPETDLPADVRRYLEDRHPEIPWERIRWKCGWPHLLDRSEYRAITLPDPHDTRDVAVYLPADWYDGSGVDPDRIDRSLLVHEGWHAAQITAYWDGRGLGLIRPFTVLYLAWWAARGGSYRDHPLEVEAYEYVDSGDVAEPVDGRSWTEVVMAASPGASKRNPGTTDQLVAGGWIGLWTAGTATLQLLFLLLEGAGWVGARLLTGLGRLIGPDDPRELVE